jgi:hypothetical protein
MNKRVELNDFYGEICHDILDHFVIANEFDGKSFWLHFLGMKSRLPIP